ncbi:MAG: hypothetical protein NVV69_18750 [Methyloversatilis sp.]|nr:hypothetical protein [Methyloversatilis sp.]MCR6668000.1 hypothetical protein [Methyloversatilis sp.]
MKPENSGTPRSFVIREVRIGPRTDAAGGLENLEREAKQMEQTDGLQLIERFAAAPEHPPLNHQRDQQQHVVSGQPQHPSPRNAENRDKEQPGKQACLSFLPGELQELDADPDDPRSRIRCR